MSERRVTIKDIANETGFTAQAVSLALRDKSNISDKTKEIIRKAARKLGYIKNITATALRHGKTYSIGVLYDSMVNPYFSIMTGYLQEAFKRLGYVLLIFTSNEHRFGTATFDFLRARNVDGIISFLEPEPKIKELIGGYGIPIMILGRTAPDGIDYICTNDKMGGELAANKLLTSGCRKLLHITESFNVACAKERYSGFSSVLKEKGLFDEEMIIVLEGKTVEMKLNEILSRGKEFDGIFAFNDMVALETDDFLEKNGMRGVKIVGYDNIQEDIKFPRRLTTIGSDKRQMAEVAAHVLVHKIEMTDDKPFNKIHDVFLVDGTTC